jgi:hypothetical protein
MAAVSTITSQISQNAIRRFSARASKPTSRMEQAVSMGLITTGVLAPFIPPAMESQREKKLGHPNAGKHHVPLCCHAR